MCTCSRDPFHAPASTASTRLDRVTWLAAAVFIAHDTSCTNGLSSSANALPILSLSMAAACRLRCGSCFGAWHHLIYTYTHCNDTLITIPHSLVARIRRSHRRGPGSIPGVGTFFCFCFTTTRPIWRRGLRSGSRSARTCTC